MTLAPRFVKAVAGCARTLAGMPGTDAAIADADAATPGGLRAYADRLAVRWLFHDEGAASRHRPADPTASTLFEALEDARLDALGAAWLPGIAVNLLAHPGARHDDVRWLAFGAFSACAVPDVKAGLVSALGAALPRDLVLLLDPLREALRDPERFAELAAAWAVRAVRFVPEPATPEQQRRLVLPTRLVSRDLPSRGDPGGTRGPLATRSSAQTGLGDGTAGGGARLAPSHGPRDSYRVFTAAHDRVVSAAALATREELQQLRVALEADLASLRTVVAKLAKRLLRVLMAEQTRHWQFDLEEGWVDSSRLARLIASSGNARAFKMETDSPFPSTVVTLLIDHSGSMRGRPMRIAALTVEIFVRVLERCGVKCEVLGFTTRDWNGGAPAEEWASSGYPEHPGRLNALEHIIVKGADVPWRRARAGLGLFLRDEMLKENIDGEALQWAHQRLLSRTEKRRILVVISDGTPMDEATLAANGYEYLDRHLVDVVTEIETRSPVQLAAIGIGHDVSRFYSNATRIRRIDDLGPALTAKLSALLGGDAPSAR